MKDFLGEPIMGFTGNRRSHHRQHFEKRVDPQSQMLAGYMRFDVSGAINEGRVHVWVKQTGKGQWDVDYMTVEVNGRAVLAEDNRVGGNLQEQL
jgi:hypothetical protein